MLHFVRDEEPSFGQRHASDLSHFRGYAQHMRPENFLALIFQIGPVMLLRSHCFTGVTLALHPFQFFPADLLVAFKHLLPLFIGQFSHGAKPAEIEGIAAQELGDVA